MNIIGHNVYHESYLIANKYVLQKLIFLLTDMSLCFLRLFMSLCPTARNMDSFKYGLVFYAYYVLNYFV